MPGVTRLTSEVTERLNLDLEAAFTAGRAVGAYAAVAIDGEIAWELPYGFADLESGKKFTGTTGFRIGSLTKTFTATAIFRLREAGLIDLDNPVSGTIPELAQADALAASLDEITIRRVLSHTAGLAPAVPVDRPYLTEFRSPHRDEALASLPNTALARDPGSGFKYSNYGFALLGEVIRRVSGVECERYIVDEICEPLDMRSTRFDPGGIDVASGYTRLHSTGNVTKVGVLDFGFEAPAGALYSTPEDLAKWAGFHLSDEDHPVLSAGSRHEMRELQDRSPDGQGGVAMNWMVEKIGDATMFRHGGGVPGYLTDFGVLPELGVGVIWLTNTWQFAGAPGRMIAEIVAGVVDEREVEPDASDQQPAHGAVRLASEPPAELAALTGIYLFDHESIVWCEWHDDALTLRLSDGEDRPGGRVKLEPQPKPDEFTMLGGPFTGDALSFERDSAGEVIGARWGAFLVRRLGPLSTWGPQD